MADENNVIELKGSATVVGDIHGQFHDLMFALDLKPQQDTWIFLGDYVDRGYHSVETLCYLLCMKLHKPDNVFLLRGNHETRSITQIYGFYDEI